MTDLKDNSSLTNSLFLRKDLKLAIDKNGVVSNSGGPYKLS